MVTNILQAIGDFFVQNGLPYEVDTATIGATSSSIAYVVTQNGLYLINLFGGDEIVIYAKINSKTSIHTFWTHDPELLNQLRDFIDKHSIK